MALTQKQLDTALDARLAGKSYTEIAGMLGVANNAGLRHAIVEYQREASAVTTANLELVVALDLGRLEMMVEENLKLAQEGSYRHVDAVIKIIRARQDTMEFLRQLQANADEDSEHKTTITTDSEEYLIAAGNINADFLENDEDDDIDPTLDLSKLTVKEREALEAQMSDLEITLNTYSEGE